MAKKPRDLERLRRRLKAIPAAVRKEVFTALDKSADEMVALAKVLVPEETGALKSTIRKSPRVADFAIDIEAGGEATTKPVRDGASATYDYALGVEYGTLAGKRPAQPFFYVSYRANRKKVRPRTRRAITKAIKATKKG
ncbi:HK97 gp10 family phage protein [Ancylobacter dichloromethanicus]|uniref:HK97 gp10 family phage protein n=1 Tax=Ancylobacter dichloromethanicus TaxID=518825 RepID=A0A9W6J954_9HYPH|nr:HK97 gp10 family phage protein [Ancylobacter dichloromethanicus]MBS7554442.1 HK97 gp10 family phage protein [Ancylobacter dichloromethanicus]GLK71570.1 hypothetical protein GCM10017643_16850 [Ancylobacter dichloromethanicus]